MLTACARRTEGIDAQILGVQFKLHFLGFGHDGHRDGRGVDAALGLGLRHALDAVDAAFKLQAAVDIGAFYRKDDFLYASQLGGVLADGLALPAAFGSVHVVHPPQAVGKERGFFAARTGTNFQNDAFFVIGILGDEQQAEILFALCQIPGDFAKFLLYHSGKRRVGILLQDLFSLLLIFLQGRIAAVFFHQGGQFLVVTHHLGVGVCIGSSLRRGHFIGQFFVPALDLVQFRKRLHGSSFGVSGCGGQKSPLLFPAPQDFFDVALDLGTRQHDLVPAALAADLEIHADTQHIKTVGTTGVRFLGLDHIADLYIHGSTPPFLC